MDPLSHPDSPAPVWGRHGVAACDHQAAAQVALDVLRQGGNAVDGAVALSAALGVLCPNYTGFGGGGFMLVWMPGMEAPEVLDYRETAPDRAYTGMFATRSQGSTRGALAVAVPGLVAGLAEALARFGSLPWAELLAPAIRIAEEGTPVSGNLIRCIRDRQSMLGLYREAARLFLGPDGQGPRRGEIWRFPDLAATLRRLAREGPREFYEGETARRVVSEIQRGRGCLSMRDLARYRPVWRRALRGTYRGYDVYTLPPPSGGGIQILQMLKLLEPFDFPPQEAGSAATFHLQAEAMRLSFAERANCLTDPDFHPVPVEEMLDPGRLARLGAELDPGRTRGLEELPLLEPRPVLPQSTASYVVTDPAGGWVVATESVNLWFGSLVVPPGTGLVLNNVMDDFSRVPGTPDAFGLVSSGRNRVQPGKRPTSSSAPALVFREGRPRMAVGSAGGPRIPTSVLQVLMNVLDHGHGPVEALKQPRVHHQWLPNEIAVEPGVPRNVRKTLRRMGHRVVQGPERSHAVCVLCAGAEPVYLAAGDPRSGGGAAGY